MSTAQNTKSTCSAMRATAVASPTTSLPTEVGTGVASVQRPATASAYDFPAEAALAATAVTSNHGCCASSDTKRWPTIPVAPSTPTLSLVAISQKHNVQLAPMPLLDGLRVVSSAIHGYGVAATRA